MKKVTLLGVLAACLLLALPVFAARHRHRYTTHYTPPRMGHHRHHRYVRRRHHARRHRHRAPTVTMHYTPPGKDQ